MLLLPAVSTPVSFPLPSLCVFHLNCIFLFDISLFLRENIYCFSFWKIVFFFRINATAKLTLYCISVQGYSVVLPEKLHTGKWNVYRYAVYVSLQICIMLMLWLLIAIPNLQVCAVTSKISN
jgi:hypothetical protein